MTPLETAIITRNDDGEDVTAIAAAEDVTIGYVYSVLRVHRPDRKRKPRTRTSKKRPLILGLLGFGHRAPRVAILAKVSNAYVYKIMDEEGIPL